jgi:hypothetical protein
LTEQPPSEGHVEDRARQLAEGGEGHEDIEGDPSKAEKAAGQILRESEERTHDPAARDHEDDSVIRRDSEETASSGDEV